MPQHKLQIVYDEAAGTVAAVHRCTAEVAGQVVSHAREVELGPGAAAAMAALLDPNREVMEQEAAELAVAHAAAQAGRLKPGQHALKIAGTLGAVGGSEATRSE